METMAGDNTSMHLYRVLCEKFVAPADHLKTIRMMNTIRDNLAFKDRLIITSGSFGEGIEFAGSDIDQVYVWKLIEVFEDLNLVHIIPNKAYFKVETLHVKPGTAHLRLALPGEIRILEDCVHAKGSIYLSSELFKKRFLNRTQPIIHGPCVSNIEGNSDRANAVHCKSWISSARHWIHRSTNSWPSTEIKQTIVDHGILFVPIGIKGSRNEAFEWRISFTVGERFLVFTFNQTQLLCYVLLKLFLVGLSSVELVFEDALCSYFLKTVMFWLSEELPQSIWKPEILLSCFMRCLNRLIYCVQYSVCPNYFIPENNMFDNKISDSRRDELLRYLNSINCQEILSKICFTSIDTPNEPKHNTSALFIESFHRMINSKLLSIVRIEQHNYQQAVAKILSCKSTRMKQMYLYHLSMICNGKSQSTQKNLFYRCNKYQYKHCNDQMCLLLQNVHHDAITGWLMLASMTYREKQYINSVRILDYALSKCTPEKIQFKSRLSDLHQNILRLEVFQKKGIIRSLSILYMGFVKFNKLSNLIPVELEMEVQEVFHVIPSVVYAYFLYFLCYYHSQDVEKCVVVLQNLNLTIHGNVFILPDDRFKAISYNILGIALQITGDKKSALETFKQAVELEPNPVYHSAARRAAMLKTT